MVANTKKKHGFQPGQSGNPKGRPKGSRNKASIIAEKLLADDLEAVTGKCIELAKEGNIQAIRLCIERILPVAKETAINAKIDLPDSIQDLPNTTAQLIKLTAGGEITPSQGEKISNLLQVHLKAIELSEIEERISKLEKTNNEV